MRAVSPHAASEREVTLGVVAWTWDLGSDLVSCPEGAHLFGKTAGPAPSFLEAMHPGDALLVARWQESVRAGAPPIDHRFRVVTPAGVRRLLARAVRVGDRVEGVCLELGTDLDELEAERCVRAALELVADAFTVLRAVRDAAGAIVDFTWIYANSEAARLLGYPPERLIGARLLELLPGNREVLFPAYVEVVTTGATYQAEVPYMHDGIAGWFENRTTRVGDGIAVWFRDITGRRRAEEELAAAHQREAAHRGELLAMEREARAIAEREARLRDEFIALVSHELRSPLNAVLGWTELLRAAGEDPATRVRALDAIERGVHAQARLLSDLLDLARLDHGKLALARTHVDLAAVVRAEIEAHHPAARASGVAVTADLEDGVWVSGDELRLAQVIGNVLTNALKFTPRGGAVAVTLRRDDATAALVIADTGVGIPATALAEVFDRFRQVDASSSRRHGGLGLGLAVARQIVEAHGGEIRAASQGAGRGAVFTIELPVAPPPGRAPAPPTLPSLAGLRLVVIEDDPDARAMMAELLCEHGAQVETAGDGLAGLELARTVAPAVLLSDIGMPGLDGLALVARLRADPLLRGLPAIAVTAYGRDRAHILAAGFDECLEKPITSAVLVRAIARLAVRSRM